MRHMRGDARKGKTHTFPRSFKTSRRTLGERKHRKFKRGPEETLLLEVTLDYAFNGLKNAEHLTRAN